MDYEQEKATFRLQVAEKFNFSRDVIDVQARDAHARAIFCHGRDGDRLVTYAGLGDVSRRLAAGLAAHGIGRGDTAILMLGRKLQWWASLAACLRAGVVASPATQQLTAKDLAYRIEAAGVSCVICDHQSRDKFQSIRDRCPGLRLLVCVDGETTDGWIDYAALLDHGGDWAGPDTRADEEALCFFTSGTTGPPKMTIHTQASYGIAHEITGRFWLDQKPGDLHWNISDTGWAKAAWSSFFAPFISGSCVFVDDAGDINAVRTLELLETYPITSMCAPPTLYRMLVQQDLAHRDFASLRQCVAAGEPLNPEVIAMWRKHTGIFIRDGYGQTETVLLCGNFPGMTPRPGSMGKPAPGYDVQLIDDDGNVVADNVEGDIAVRIRPDRPVGLFKEYRDAVYATAKAFRGDWYVTGDRAIRDADGFLWFVGRADDVIVSAGYRIGPFEVESALLEHEAVAESAVVSSPDPTRGAVVKAFIVLASGFEPSQELIEQIQAHVRSVTAPYKYPRRIEFVDSLPKTISGKIRRKELRGREWS